jgi:hypothetical protein
MTRYQSKDGRWSVTVISLNGAQLLRVEHDTFGLGDGRFAPTHSDGTHRSGPTRTAFGFLVADVPSVASVALWLPLSELEAVT